MTRIDRIGVMHAAKVSAKALGMLGLALAVLYSFGGFFFELFTDSLNTGTALAFLALLGMPLLFAVFGFLAGAFVAVLYNYIAGLRFGIDRDSE